MLLIVSYRLHDMAFKIHVEIVNNFFGNQNQFLFFEIFCSSSYGSHRKVNQCGVFVSDGQRQGRKSGCITFECMQILMHYVVNADLLFVMLDRLH